MSIIFEACSKNLPDTTARFRKMMDLLPSISNVLNRIEPKAAKIILAQFMPSMKSFFNNSLLTAKYFLKKVLISLM